jgi:hypothetical protein
MSASSDDDAVRWAPEERRGEELDAAEHLLSLITGALKIEAVRNRTACQQIVNRLHLLHESVEALTFLLGQINEDGGTRALFRSTVSPTVSRLTTAVELAEKRLYMSSSSAAFGALRAKLNAKKETQKFFKVLDELMRGLLELNAKVNTLLVKVHTDIGDGGGRITAVAQFPYTPTGPDELTLVPGATVTVTETSGFTWWRGVTGVDPAGSALLFPVSYVTVVIPSGSLEAVGKETRGSSVKIGRKTVAEWMQVTSEATSTPFSQPAADEKSPVFPSEQVIEETLASRKKPPPLPARPPVRLTAVNLEEASAST